MHLPRVSMKDWSCSGLRIETQIVSGNSPCKKPQAAAVAVFLHIKRMLRTVHLHQHLLHADVYLRSALFDLFRPTLLIYFSPLLLVSGHLQTHSKRLYPQPSDSLRSEHDSRHNRNARLLPLPLLLPWTRRCDWITAQLRSEPGMSGNAPLTKIESATNAKSEIGSNTKT
jgi:hypothetical protein